jgi:hypothetical protein
VVIVAIIIAAVAPIIASLANQPTVPVRGLTTRAISQVEPCRHETTILILTQSPQEGAALLDPRATIHETALDLRLGLRASRNQACTDHC